MYLYKCFLMYIMEFYEWTIFFIANIAMLVYVSLPEGLAAHGNDSMVMEISEISGTLWHGWVQGNSSHRASSELAAIVMCWPIYT